ncbi:MAG TPA: MFS transporter [Dehalococcoidales bacterium]|nr:MFS transporter [Dehalococcoidales bacterium]
MAKATFTKSETKEARIYRLRWWTLATIAISVLVTILDTTVVTVALPTIQRQLTATSSELMWMMNAYTMILGALVITMGSLSDRFGKGKLLQIGLAVFGISSLGAILSSSPIQLIISRIFMGAGASMILPCTLSIITDVFPVKERGQAIGIWAGLNAVGIALGPIIGGLLVEHFKWNSIFMINLPVVIIALILGWFFVPNTKDNHPRKLDLIGNLLSLSGLAALVYGLINGGSRGWTDAQVMGALFGSVVIIGLFILWERRTREPMLELGFFRNTLFSSGIGILVVMGLAINGFMYVGTYYLQFVQGYDPLGMGLRIIPFACGMLIGSVLANKFVKRFGTRWVMSIGFIGTSVVFFFMSLLKIETSFWLLGVEFVLFGLFTGNISAPVTNIIMSALPKGQTGIGSAINNTFRQIAGTIGVAITGSILGSVYTSHFLHSAATISGLPAALTQKASNSVGMAIGIANSGQLPAALSNALTQTARESFMSGWHVIMLICCGILLVGAVIVLKFVPKRQGISKQDVTQASPQHENKG